MERNQKKSLKWIIHFKLFLNKLFVFKFLPACVLLIQCTDCTWRLCMLRTDRSCSLVHVLEIMEYNDRAGRVKKRWSKKCFKMPSVSFITILQSHPHASSQQRGCICLTRSSVGCLDENALCASLWCFVQGYLDFSLRCTCIMIRDVLNLILWHFSYAIIVL